MHEGTTEGCKPVEKDNFGYRVVIILTFLRLQDAHGVECDVLGLQKED
jgi:hypothetical protein